MRAFALASVLVACGGRAIVSPDATTELDAATDADSSSDGMADVMINLPPCRTSNDCFWMQTCQLGYCCAGMFDGRECRCGIRPGCTIGDACCDADSGFACEAPASCSCRRVACLRPPN